MTLPGVVTAAADASAAVGAGAGPVAGAALAGAAAGLGVAVPLGAIGVLLLEEGRRGRRAAASAACAVASVDALYAAAATALGARLAGALAAWEPWTRAGAALVLVAVAVRGLLGLRRPLPEAGVETGAAVGRRGAAGTFLRFAALTLVNPMTALYFAALVTGGGGPGGPAEGGAFVAGVLVASLGWQLLLAAAGVSMGARLSPTARRLTYCAGYGLVLHYAVRLGWPV
ncbi:lysine transporter LysE [Kitasatospora sp. NPDC054939]